MPKYFVRAGEHYALWSTIVDAPIQWFESMTDAEDEYGTEVKVYGLAKAAEFNRAGKDETVLTYDQLYNWIAFDRMEEVKQPTGTVEE